MKTKELIHRCQNSQCRKKLIGKRSDAKFCSPRCRSLVAAAEKPKDDREVFISQACRFPRQPQAEIVKADRKHRHPVTGKRPEFSGYCVVADRCECKVAGCHGEVA
jgi:hypothetical protein